MLNAGKEKKANEENVPIGTLPMLFTILLLTVMRSTGGGRMCAATF